jgi:DNA-binding CsgD family transcriptional regulator
VRTSLKRIRSRYGAPNTYALIAKLEIPPVADPERVSLTPRGKEVLQSFMDGLTYKKMGKKLGISRDGIRQQRDRMLNQNGCATTNELIIKYRTWNEFGNHPAAGKASEPSLH